MSWWDTGEDDDVIGDEPADLIRHSLQEIAAGRKPKLEELLGAIGVVTNGIVGKEMLENVPANLRGITAKLKSDETVSVRLYTGDEVNKDLLAVLTDNLRAIQRVYQERWERNPRLSEWLSAFAFVLRYRPE